MCKQFVEWLSNQYTEKRTDVSEACEHFLKHGNIPKDFKPESRFIKAKIPNLNIELEYDTLTTEISYRLPNETLFKQCTDHDYVDL